MHVRWPPFTVAEFVKDNLYTTYLTLCAIIEWQPPPVFFDYKLGKKFSWLNVVVLNVVLFKMADVFNVHGKTHNLDLIFNLIIVDYFLSGFPVTLSVKRR
jgi:hypothetical protein